MTPSLLRSNIATQCIGNNVLNGLNFNLKVNIGVWFAGLIGLVLAEYSLSCFVLWVGAFTVSVISMLTGDPDLPIRRCQGRFQLIIISRSDCSSASMQQRSNRNIEARTLMSRTAT